MYISFNELSTDSVFACDNTEIARKSFNDFLLFLKGLITRDILEGLFIPESNPMLDIAPNYSTSDWLNDPLVSREYKQFFLSIRSKYCVILKSSDFLSEYSIEIDNNKYISEGGLFAVENETACLSVLTHEFWKLQELNGEYHYYDDDMAYQEECKSIPNWSIDTNVDSLEKYVSKKEFSNIASGDDLWDKRETLFPNLVFCESVKGQLHEDPEKFHVVRVMERLTLLQDYFGSLNRPYSIKDIGANARTESMTVKKDPDLKKYRLFKLPDGSAKYFFDHISFTGKYAAGRIYFLPSPDSKKCYIGYIGRHLPTAKY